MCKFCSTRSSIFNCVANSNCKILYQEREEYVHLLRFRRIVSHSLIFSSGEGFIGSFIRTVVPRGLTTVRLTYLKVRNCFSARQRDIQVMSYVQNQVDN